MADNDIPSIADDASAPIAGSTEGVPAPTAVSAPAQPIFSAVPAGSSSVSPATVSFTAAMDSYIRYYAAGMGHTARAKRLDLERFERFLAHFRGYADPQKLTLQDWDLSSVKAFVDHELAQGSAPASVARRLATLKHFGRTLTEKLTGFQNPAREARPPKTGTRRPPALDGGLVEASLAKARARKEQKNSFIRSRNETLFLVLLNTGLRADEVRLLTRGQLDDSLEWLLNVRTKGRRFRNVYLASGVREPLAAYLEERTRELGRYYSSLSRREDMRLPLFLSGYNAQAGEPQSFQMGAKTIWRAVHELSTAAQLHPHLLRHTFAHDLLDHSRDVRLVAQALGHSDVRITMRYTERTEDAVAQALEAMQRSKKS